jgi:hypothetical protein
MSTSFNLGGLGQFVDVGVGVFVLDGVDVGVVVAGGTIGGCQGDGIEVGVGVCEGVTGGVGTNPVLGLGDPSS